ncbi:hypothetical protein A0H81_08591 [Grifola frondosa]|uniref:Uncharacterized protein n=1 Tax=Grifola frondosa TaxID=5627 RepID=A0A1C7M3L5_GRIFR|nr:hypothetical protein A0H81_08591 [Grifola frondosa]
MESITLRALRRLSIGAPNHAFIRFDCVAVIRWFLEHIISPAGSLTRIYGLRETELCVLDDLRLATVNRAERAHIQILSSSIHITACGSSSGIRVESEIESPEFVLPFFPALAAVDIQELWFSVVRSRRPYCMESQFDVISAMFPGVTTLVLLHDVPLDALLPPDTGAPLFPALDSLRIYQDTNFFQALPLVYVAKKRAEHGYRIRHLVVQRKAHPYSTSSGWDADGKVQEGDWSVDTSNDEQREVEFIHHALSAYVDIVEVATYEQPPSMEVPDYCNEYPHRYWPAW